MFGIWNFQRLVYYYGRSERPVTCNKYISTSNEITINEIIESCVNSLAQCEVLCTLGCKRVVSEYVGILYV